MMNGSDNTFEHAPDTFNRVGVNMSPSEWSFRMIDGVMDVAMVQIGVRTETIRTNHAALFNVFSVREIE